MSHHHQKQGGAGLGAGLDFFGPPRNRKFTKVVDRRGQPLRGLWLRGNTYYARITVEDPNGVKQERRLALDASTLSEAKDALARLRAEPTEQKRRKKSVPLFPEFWPAYIEAVRHQKRERTIKTEEVFLRQWEAWLGAIPINRVSTAQVIGFRTERLSRGLSGRTANLAVTVLNNLLYHAQALELIKSLPTEGMKPIRWKPKKRPLFTVDEINRLCTDAIGAGRNGQMLSDYLRLMACCGSRRNETLRLRWSDVDWQRQQLWVGADGLAKNHEARVVDFNPALAAHLEAMHNRREQNSVYLFPAPRRGTDDRPARNLKESLRKIRDDAGCPGFGFHDCRHHFISYAVMSGIDYLTIARWVGHKDGGILIGRVYGHLTDVHARKQAQRLQFNV